LLKVLILHASAGAGHQRAAEALALALPTVSEGCEVVVKDILEFTPSMFRTGYAKGYLNLVRRAPDLWGYMYAQADRSALQPYRQRIRTVFNKLNTRTFFRFYHEFDPDAVICTHFMPLEIVSTMLKEGRTSAPLHCVVTDFAVHSLWLVPRLHTYFVATDEARRFLARHGYERVRKTGIPVDPGFGLRADRTEARRRLGLQVEKPTLLILSGGFGVGPTAELVKAFCRTPGNFQLIVVSGRNAKLQAEVQQAASPLGPGCLVLGFVENLHEVMDAADLVVTKPGGLSTSESLAKGIPLMLVDPIPGQEQRNSDYLLEHGAAVRLHDIADAAEKVERVLSDAPRWARLKENASRLGSPHAAREIAQWVVQSVSE
jgi:processive 1,2-diacylglycerol beta-glucosyltransferase